MGLRWVELMARVKVQIDSHKFYVLVIKTEQKSSAPFFFWNSEMTVLSGFDLVTNQKQKKAPLLWRFFSSRSFSLH